MFCVLVVPAFEVSDIPSSLLRTLSSCPLFVSSLRILSSYPLFVSSLRILSSYPLFVSSLRTLSSYPAFSNPPRASVAPILAKVYTVPLCASFHFHRARSPYAKDSCSNIPRVAEMDFPFASLAVKDSTSTHARECTLACKQSSLDPSEYIYRWCEPLVCVKLLAIMEGQLHGNPRSLSSITDSLPMFACLR